MSHQVGLTVSGQVVPERLEELLRVVDRMAEDPGDNPVIPFGQLPYTHFGRVVVLAGRVGRHGHRRGADDARLRRHARRPAA